MNINTLPPFDLLCNDTLVQVVSFLDFASSVRFSKLTSKNLRDRVHFASCHRERLDAAPFYQLWQDIYRRHHFSPIESLQQKLVDYIDQCRRRRRLFGNLMGRSSNPKRSCFNLPHKFFNFVPITPLLDDALEWNDPPPVDFECASFVLTSCGVGSELVLLNPLDGSLVVYNNFMENAVKSDEVMIEQTMYGAAPNMIVCDEWMRDEHVRENPTPPTQTLLDKWSHHYVDADLLNFFNNRITGRTRNQNHRGLPESHDGIVVDYVGIDSKPILAGNQSIGSVVAVARALTTEDSMFQQPSFCTEIIMWKKFNGEHGSRYEERFVCRVPQVCNCVDFCTTNNRIFVIFDAQDEPNERENQVANLDIPLRFGHRRRTVFAYQLLEKSQKSEQLPDHLCFPRPLFSLECVYPASTVLVDPSGTTVIVGTSQNTVEIWETGVDYNARRQCVLDIPLSLKQSITTFNAFRNGKEASPNLSGVARELEMEGSSRLVVGPLQNNSPIVESIHCCLHRPVENCGFVTMQRDSAQGTTLLLWKLKDSIPEGSKGTDFDIVSLVHLPLSAQRMPRVSYDGRRLVVVGQDDVGMIILVYHVLSTWEDLDSFNRHIRRTVPVKKFGDDSSGLYNFSALPQLASANRIRHAGLGGLSDFHSIFMTCNERFIVVNTKTGNLVGGQNGATDGLLIIDLQDQP